MMNGLKKNIGRENPKKMAGTSVKGIVKTQLEVLEVENAHYVLIDTVYIVH